MTEIIASSQPKDFISLGGKHTCANPECVSKNNGNELVFNGINEFNSHVNELHANELVTGSTLCKYCNKVYDYSKKFHRIEKEDGTFEYIPNTDRPTVKAVSIGVVLHPDCKRPYLKAQGFDVE